MGLRYHSDMNPEVRQLLTEMLAQAHVSAFEWMVANTADSGIKRRAYLSIEKHLNSFLNNRTNREWLIMPGLRGVGKTTMLTQLYNDPRLAKHAKFYLSLDRVKSIGGRMIDVVAVIEEAIGGKIEDSDKPVFILLDEVQYMEDWALVLKTIHDRAKKLFIVSTGSSAILLQTNPDIARRADVIKVHPLCFTEFIMINQAHNERGSKLKFPVTGLSSYLKEAMFDSENATQAHSRLTSLNGQVSQYWSGIAKAEAVRKYMSYGTLPFTLTLPNESVIWARVYQTLSEVLARDVNALGKLSPQTIGNLPRLLFLLAHAERKSLNALSSTLGIDIKTIRGLLDELEHTEIITAIKPKGASFGKTTKPYKYLFTSPAMRLALVNSGGTIKAESYGRDMLRGQLLEDIVGMYLKRMFMDGPKRAVVEYDTADGGADFIISQTGEKANSVIIEAGTKKTTSRQAGQTLKDIGGKYGLIVTDQPLKIDTINNTVYVPLEFFLLA